VQMLHKCGVNNFVAVKEKIREEPIFRFDNFLKSRSESELNKRVQSLYKLLEKEREMTINGYDQSALKDK
jgi:SWI/SNF-related matrix-associated actin-dependent regulator of chromatin subfamily A member 5